MIQVTKSFLPPLDSYIEYLKGIWERGQLTNHGPLVLELEKVLADYLQVKHVFFVANGTMALQIAAKALGIQRKIITTPFSCVATTSAMVWEGIEPIFADIDPRTFTISPASIRAELELSSEVEAILATHVYGNPCEIEALIEIAGEYKIPLIFDGAHAFGVDYKGKPLASYGDVTALSFHATKIFHTIEGGALVTNNDAVAHKIGYMRNFGYNGPEDFFGIGINAKASEFQAAMGLSVFPYVDDIIEKRSKVVGFYQNCLLNSGLQMMQIQDGTTRVNHAYFPVLFSTEECLLAARLILEEKQIFPRRYFYPSLNRLNYVNNNLINDTSTDFSKRVLCLPLSPDLTEKDVNFISELIIQSGC
jgi:dTDP-4-amino-4,6-dideoxygalactose transaminase